MIEIFTIFVGLELAIGGHRDFDAFAILHAEFYEDIHEVFLLRYEDAIALLTDLETQEELQLAHHGHLILFLHHVTKLITIVIVSAAEDNVIHIDLAHKQFTVL